MVILSGADLLAAVDNGPLFFSGPIVQLRICITSMESHYYSTMLPLHFNT